MNRKVIISPSMMCSTPGDMEAYIRKFERSGIELLHFDVMDGHYVPNVMMGVRDYQFIKRTTQIPVDVHLMCTAPEMFIEYFDIKPGDWVCFHPETARNAYSLCQALHNRGCKAGIALSPATPVSWLQEMISVVDYVMVMAVNPGFAGQKMVPDHLDKLARIRKIVDEYGKDIEIFVDGNTTAENAKKMFAAGATALVGGTASVFKGGVEGFEETFGTYLAAIAEE